MRPAHWQPPAESMVAAKIAIEGSDYFASDELSEILIGGPSHHLHIRLRRQGTLLGLRFVRRGHLHPAFQFDRVAKRVDPPVTKTNRLPG